MTEDVSLGARYEKVLGGQGVGDGQWVQTHRRNMAPGDISFIQIGVRKSLDVEEVH